MYQFSHSWPYDRVMNDHYFHECPFCGANNVLLPIKKDAIENARDGVKTHVVMPCCHEKIVIVQMDDDYIWSDRPIRKA